jgi:hypothetical protein
MQECKIKKHKNEYQNKIRNFIIVKANLYKIKKNNLMIVKNWKNYRIKINFRKINLSKIMIVLYVIFFDMIEITF